GGTIRLLIAPYDAAMHDMVTQIVQTQTKRQRITSRTDLTSGQITLLPAPDSARITQLDETGFIQTYRPQPHILVTGAVHIAQALAQMAHITGYDLSIIDPRSGFATAERFPSASLYETWPEEFFKTNQPDSFTAIVALSHIPHLDDPALTAALNSDCFYIGALGSRKTHAKRLERLSAAGFEATNLERIHAPIGLAISAQEPAEIAVAILAEIIQAYRKA
ncbi:MAG: XdhC family protein, partial [Brucellaceae bacterium]|nr:XdhC family protein [Brucellaceae bacterium]